MLWTNVVIGFVSVAVWIAAAIFGWLSSVTFVSHVSMAALVISAIAGVAAGMAAVESEDA
jgi:hypothetical protein